MLEVLEFIFSSFWVWLGTWFLIMCPAAILRNGHFIKIERPQRKK
jgi:hypothetical protein